MRSTAIQVIRYSSLQCVLSSYKVDTHASSTLSVQVAFAGCTACVAHVGMDGIHVANAGDCRAVLGVQNEDGSWSALPLSRDHNSQNQAEVERIKAQHPPSESNTVVTDDRLLGVGFCRHMQQITNVFAIRFRE